MQCELIQAQLTYVPHNLISFSIQSRPRSENGRLLSWDIMEHRPVFQVYYEHHGPHHVYLKIIPLLHTAGGVAAGRVLLSKLVARPELDVADLEPVFEAALHADSVDQRLADLGAVVVG